MVEPADPQKRLQALKRFIEIADECSQRNNLFSAFSILSGLNVAAVQKLRKTWAVRRALLLKGTGTKCLYFTM